MKSEDCFIYETSLKKFMLILSTAKNQTLCD